MTAQEKKPHILPVTLSRTLGVWEVTLLGVGALLGGGIFTLLGHAAGLAGGALVLAIPIAGGAIYPSYEFIHPVFRYLPSGFTLRPEIAGFAMAFSSVSVVTNSLLLRRYTPPIEKQP